MGMDRVKNHFETAADDFDRQILKLIPCYDEMIRALISAIPFDKEACFKMMDLGCGTGTISQRVKDSYPDVRITCLDISKKMLQMAECKLGGDACYQEGNFEEYEFTERFDLIVSSLALHHLETEEKLRNFYGKIYTALTPGGFFINVDVVLGSDPKLQETYMKKWVEFMEKNMDPAAVRSKVLVDYYAEDRPVRLTQHIKLLGDCGFGCVDVLYKVYNFAVIAAKK